MLRRGWKGMCVNNNAMKLTREALERTLEELRKPRTPYYVTHPAVYKQIMSNPTLTTEEKLARLISHPSTSVQYRRRR